MTDTIVTGDVYAQLSLANGPWGPYWSDVSTGIIVFLGSSINISFARTTDKGATWSTTQIQAGTVESFVAWYDKETPGDTGTLVHIAWLDSGASDALYVTVDVSDATVGTIRTIDSTITVSPTDQLNRISITKAVNGNLLVAFSTQTEIECYRSTDSGANWTARADVFETATQEDWIHLFPADVDAGDICALFWDRSADEVSLKMYDDSADSWTETSISGSLVDDLFFYHMDGSVRHSDSHLLLVVHSNFDSAGDDLLTWDLTVNSIASPTITAKTNIFTNVAEQAHVSIFINQQNDDVYVTHQKGGTYLSAVDCVYYKSTDDMGTWSAEQAYSENTADDFRHCQAGRTVGNDGGRFQPVFYNDDFTDIFVNETNDIEIAAVSVEVVTQVDVYGSQQPVLASPSVVAY